VIRIALDAMGGDFAPDEIVKGAVLASQELPDLEIFLVGSPDKIIQALKKHQEKGKLPIVTASEVIGMNEHPVQAVKQKKDASINVAVSLVKDGKADAVISAGNTGAIMAAALFKLGRIPGVERPAIATEFPLPTGKVLLLDMGANVDCKPKHLVQFAMMGRLYSQDVMRVENPRVGLLNLGEEKEKGNELTRETWPLLKQAQVNFIGNVESKEIFNGTVDVIVCDGFVGNLILKFGESLGTAIYKMMKKELSGGIMNKLGLALLYPGLKRLKKLVTYDEYGAAPLLGIQGIVYKAHGRSKAAAIKTAIKNTAEAIKGDLISSISKVSEKI